MAGSNDSPAQRGGPPPHWPAESEEQARAYELERWRQQQAHLAQHGYGHPGAPQHGHQHQQPAGYDPAAYGHAPQPGAYSQPHAPQSHAPQPHAPIRDPFEPPFGDAGYRQQGQQAPHFERFAPVPPPQDYPSGYDPHQLPVGGHEHVQDPFNPHRGPASFDPHHGYAAPRGHPAEPHPDHHEMRADPQSWDFSNYHPGHVPQGYHDQQPAVHDPHAPPEWGAPMPAAHDPHWSHAQAGQGQWGPEGGHPHPSHYDQQAPGQHPHYQLDPAYDHGDQHLAGEAAADEYDLPEETRRGPSTVLVIGMLVGAIVVGGGLAFAYRHLGGTSTAKVAEIKRQTAPEKVRPQDPGGKTIEHSSNVFLNRSTADGGSTSETRQSDVDGSAKKVATIPIVVNRDGSLTPQSSSGAVPAPSDGSGVPGLVLDGFGPPPRLRPGAGQAPPPQAEAQRLPPPAEAQSARLPPPPPPVARTPPRIADLPLPKVTNAPPPVTAAVERPAPPPVRKPPVAERDDYVAPHTASAAEAPRRKPEPAVSRSGYVAVLASKRSRQEALNTFADLHSQYPDVLGGVTPDVKEANLGEKGVWFRLIGGPPGSREAARGICVKLKARGMKDCWPVAY